MKVLHIVRSEPDDKVRDLVQASFQGVDAAEVRLYEGQLDYDRMVEDIFASDWVVCWW